MKLRDFYSKNRKVKSIVIKTRNETFGFHAAVKERCYEFMADDDVDIVISCVSSACTGSSGYALWRVVYEAVLSDTGHVKGQLACDGREHPKPGALCCTGTLHYEAWVTFG